MSRAGAIKPESDHILDRPMGDTDGIDFEIIELLFFAYRDFISDPDAILDTSGFGRAHHRVVHFVNREPGLTVAALLDTLKITNVLASHADGMAGLSNALFDRIVINGSLPEAPKHLIEQLASNGIMIAPVGPPDGVQQLTRMTKIGSRFQNEVLFDVRMQPLKPGLSKAI